MPSLSSRFLRRTLAPLAATALAVALAPACSGEAAEPKGQLVVALATDMEIPKDVTSVRIKITTFGRDLYNELFDVGAPPNRLQIPATLTLVAGDNPSIPVTIRVIAYAGPQGTEARVMRKAITTIPTDRIALLPMPIQWLCWQELKDTGQVDAKGAQVFESACPSASASTCDQGGCVSATIDVRTLATYAPQAVFGGASGPGQGGECLDVTGCFSEGAQVQLDTTSCSFEAPTDAQGEDSQSGVALDNYNLALALPAAAQRGICTETSCLIPLDQAQIAEATPSGWTVSENRVVLPSKVCQLLAKGEIAAVVATRACVSKTRSLPTCGPWSSVTGGQNTSDAGGPMLVDASDDGGQTDAGVMSETGVEEDGSVVLIDSSVDAAPDATMTLDAGVDAAPEAGQQTAPKLGAACSSDLDCQPGNPIVKCLGSSNSTIPNAWPAGGLCSVSCDSNPGLCDKLKPGSICFDYDGADANAGAYCIEGCAGAPSDGATLCSGRGDMACDVVPNPIGGTSVQVCVPTCGADSQCAGVGGNCNQASGLCTGNVSSGFIQIGDTCTTSFSPDGGFVDDCGVGYCETFSNEGGLSEICSARCVMGSDVGCGFAGVVPDGGSANASAGCFLPNPAGLSFSGAAGLCTSLCDCDNPCGDPNQTCFDFDNAAISALYGKPGYCALTANPAFGVFELGC